MTTALTILAIAAITGSVFVIGSLIVSGRADDAADDLADKLIQQDWPHLPPANSSFHETGPTR